MMSKLILLVYTSWKQLKFLKGFSLNDTLKKKITFTYFKIYQKQTYHDTNMNI